MLENWTYYDLQQEIEHNAKREGLKVEHIDLKYTSLQCNKCGYTSSENRNKNDLDKFKCGNYGNSENADYNVSLIIVKRFTDPECEKIALAWIKKKKLEKVIDKSQFRIVKIAL